MSLSEICASMISKRDPEHDKLLDRNVIDFLTAPWGLGLGLGEVPPLYPAQRFILKAYYGMEPDNGDVRDIIIKDKYNEKELYRFNEHEYMDYLRNEGRLNRVIDKPFPNVVLCLGRRSGKTTVTACIIAYETYRLLNKYCPQEYYGIMPEDEITFTCVATSRDTAAFLFKKVVGHIERSEFFRKFRTKSTSQWINLRTQRDIDRYGTHGRSSISVRVSACSAKGLRGANNMIVALDEMSFFFLDETTGQKKPGAEGDHDDRSVYEAATPSVAKFKSPSGDRPEGKIICISSPGAKSGKFYEEYERGFAENSEDLLVIQAPSWEIDPNLSTTYLKNKYKQNPITFRSEFGAEFSDRLFGWIEDPQIVRQCIVPGLHFKQNSMERVPHFMGIDIGMKKDGTAIAVCHWVKEMVAGASVDRIELDASDVRYLKLSDREKDEKEKEDAEAHGQILDGADGVPGVTRLPYFDPQELADWIEEFTKRFLVVRGLMDQYFGMGIQPLLLKKGLKQFEYRDFHDSLNSYVYQNLLTLFVGSEVRLPEGEPMLIDGRTEKDTPLVREMLTLQAEQKSKYIIRVDHPDREGMHNDLSDAFSRACLLAVEYRNKGFGAITTSAISTSTGLAISAMRAAKHSDIMRASLNRPSGRYLGRALSAMGRSPMSR